MTSAGGIHTRVAVKLLRAEVDPESEPVERLRDEGRLLGMLDHHVLSELDEVDSAVSGLLWALLQDIWDDLYRAYMPLPGGLDRGPHGGELRRERRRRGEQNGNCDQWGAAAGHQSRSMTRR